VVGYEPAHWSDFALAQIGASATLLGLVFVGFSINLRAIVGSRLLVNRAGEAVVVLGGVLVSASAVLIPAQDRGSLSAELLVVAIVTVAVVGLLQRGAHAVGPGDDQPGAPRASVAVRRFLGLGAQVLLAVTAITLAVKGGGGLYWWPAAVVIAYMSALTDAWVLLIEILR
jgi:hypothetical protein